MPKKVTVPKKEKIQKAAARGNGEAARPTNSQPRVPTASHARADRPSTSAKANVKREAHTKPEPDRAVGLGPQAPTQPVLDTSGTPAEPRDSRLPPVGSTLVKRDRRGTARCQCTVGETGIRYRETIYPSLSAAASAAAADLGLNSQVNGYVFWGLAKPARSATKPSEQLRKLAARYQERLAAMLKQPASDGFMNDVRQEVEAHAARLRELLAPAE